MRKEERLSIFINGELLNRYPKLEIHNLMFSIEDYIGLKERLLQIKDVVDYE